SIMRPRTTPADNRCVGRLPFLTCLAPLGQHAGRAARITAASAAAFAAAHRVTDRILRYPPVMRLAAQPTLTPRLAEADVHVIRIANRPDGGPTLRTDATNFAGRQRDLRPAAFACGKRCARARATANLAATARLHFEIMHRHA